MCFCPQVAMLWVTWSVCSFITCTPHGIKHIYRRALRGGQFTNTCPVSGLRPVKSKCQFHPSADNKDQETEWGYSFTLSLTSALYDYEWSKLHSGNLTLRNDLASLV